MNNKDIWIIFTRSSAMDGCPLDMDGSEYFYVEVFVPVENTTDSTEKLAGIIEQARIALLDEKFVLNDVSKCIRYIENEWTDDTDLNNEIRQTADKAVQADKLTFNVFRSEEIQEDCHYKLQAIED